VIVLDESQESGLAYFRPRRSHSYPTFVSTRAEIGTYHRTLATSSERRFTSQCTTLAMEYLREFCTKSELHNDVTERRCRTRRFAIQSESTCPCGFIGSVSGRIVDKTSSAKAGICTSGMILKPLIVAARVGQARWALFAAV
jgi:hypothetical protein